MLLVVYMHVCDNKQSIFDGFIDKVGTVNGLYSIKTFFHVPNVTITTC